MLAREEELWGAASMLLNQFGDRIDDHIADRIKAFALESNEQAVTLWRDLAAKIDQLRCPTVRLN